MTMTIPPELTDQEADYLVRKFLGIEGSDIELMNALPKRGPYVEPKDLLRVLLEGRASVHEQQVAAKIMFGLQVELASKVGKMTKESLLKAVLADATKGKHGAN